MTCPMDNGAIRKSPPNGQYQPTAGIEPALEGVNPWLVWGSVESAVAEGIQKW